MSRWLALVAVAPLLGAGCTNETQGPTVRLEATLLIFDFSDSSTVAVGAEACVVEPIEGACAVSNDGGLVVMDVPAESDVLIRITREDLYPFLLPVRTTTDPIVIDFPIYPRPIVDAVATSLSFEIDPAMGQVTTAANPSQAANAGETFTVLDEETGAPVDADVFYISAGGLPDPRATSTPENGYGGVANLPPGDYVIETGYNERCVVFRGWVGRTPDGADALRLPVRAGSVTGVQWVDCAP